MPRPALTVDDVIREATQFAALQSALPVPELFGVTDGKAVGTHIERSFKAYLTTRYLFQEGNAAKGIDFPELKIDVKVTSVEQPQSSSPFTAARQKVFGLGYSLLVFVYEKIDHPKTATATLDMRHTIFVDAAATADYQTTSGIAKILANDGNVDDVMSFLIERNLPADEIELRRIATDLVAAGGVPLGYLTISNALQWRLQYTRAISNAGSVPGIARLR